MALLGVILFFVQRTLNDPLRTLRQFPVGEYYENHSSLEGTRFKARLKAVNQIGWKEEMGRLIVFHAGDNADPVVVLIEPAYDKLSFEPGETYAAEVRVGEGGLLTANHLRKE